MRWLARIFLPLTLAGCASYQPQPLTHEEVDHALAAPAPEAIRVAAASIRHPILQPIEFNLEDGLSPDEAAILAVVANPALRAARDKWNLRSAQLLQAGILPNPTLSASVGPPIAGSTSGALTEWGLGVEYDITALITHRAELNAAQAEADSVALDVAWQEWQAAEDAKLHAVRLMWLLRQSDVTARAVEDSARHADALVHDLQQGLITSVEVEAAQSQRRQFEMTAMEVQKAVAEERVALNQAIGLPPQTMLAIQSIDVSADSNSDSSASEPSPSDETIAAELEDHRLDLMALRLGYQSQEEKLRAAVLSQFPKMTVGLAAARDNGDVISLGPTLALEVPLFDRGQGRIAVERASRQQLFDEYIARVFDSQSDVAKLRAQVAATSKVLAAADRYQAGLESLLAAYQAALQNGAADVLKVYDIQARLAEARLETLKHRQELAELQIGLEVASGRILTGATP